MLNLEEYKNLLTLRNRAARAAWGVVWLVLYRPSPTPLHAWRRFVLRCFGAAIGRGAHPYPAAKVWAPWNLAMGDHSCLANGVDCYCVAPVRLGNNSVVSQRTFLCAGTHDYNDPKFPLRTLPITIGDGVWIAAEAFVGPGVVIGDGAVVGARACVCKDVEQGCIVSGNPARVIRRRSPPEFPFITLEPLHDVS